MRSERRVVAPEQVARRVGRVKPGRPLVVEADELAVQPGDCRQAHGLLPYSPMLAPGRTHRPVPCSGQDRAHSPALPGRRGTRPLACRTGRTITPSPMDCSALASASTAQSIGDDLLRPTGRLDVAVVQV